MHPRRYAYLARWAPHVATMVLLSALIASVLLFRGPDIGPPPPLSCRLDPAPVPAPVGPDGRAAVYLHTCGNQIFDARGHQVRIAGISWFGVETGTYAPHGLWVRNWQQIMDQITALGYNTIRVPFSNEALEPDRLISGVNFQLNPDLQGLTGLEMLDKLVAGARERGLKIILDRHRPTSDGQSSLWYTDEVPEERWLADWRMLAARYRGDDTVIGVDLQNEPRDNASWGTGDLATDWRLAAERGGDAVLEANPHLLIFVQGVERFNGDWYWWGGDLRGVRDAPVRLQVPNRVVYSPHEYGPSVFEQGWFQDLHFPNNLPEIWNRHWGFISREGIAPVVLGEFGGRSVGTDRDGQWHQMLVAYLANHRISAVSWALNPNSGDTGGILDDNWETVQQSKQQAYRKLLAPRIAGGSGGAGGRVPERPKVVFRQEDPSPETSNIGFTLRIRNDGPEPLALERCELRYWLTVDGRGGAGAEVVVDWAAVGEGHVMADLVPASRGAQDHYVRVRFDRNAGSIPPYQQGADVQLRMHRLDWMPYRQDNDYSFSRTGGAAQPLALWGKVTLYIDGVLVWGAEP